MQTISRRTLILATLVVVAIVALVLLVHEKSVVSSATPAEATPDAVAVQATLVRGLEEKMMTPMVWTMEDGVQAVRGLATFAGEGNGDYAYIIVRAGEQQFTFLVSPQTNIFYSADVFAHSNQPAPTAENPQEALRKLQDTPVQVRYDPGDPPTAKSILIIGGGQR